MVKPVVPFFNLEGSSVCLMDVPKFLKGWSVARYLRHVLHEMFHSTLFGVIFRMEILYWRWGLGRETSEMQLVVYCHREVVYVCNLQRDKKYQNLIKLISPWLLPG